MAKTTRFWFVIPTDVKGDGKLWMGPNTPTLGAFREELQPAAPRPQRGRGQAAVEEDVPAVDPGYGFGLAMKEQKDVMAFTTRGKASEYAKDRAAKQPGVLFGIFSCDQVFETTEPNIITKKFNDAGELVLVEGN